MALLALALLALARCPTSHSVIRPPQLDREKKYDKRLLSQDKDSERSLSNCLQGQNRLDLEKINLLY